MANQITPLNYANTFADWVVTTNSVLAETNDIGANNYTKSNGTFAITSPGTGLQVSNNAIVQGVLSVSGTGSSAVVQNQLTVQGTIYASNTVSGVTALKVDGMANVANLNITGAGVGLNVANASVMSGAVAMGSTLTVSSNARVAGVNANSYITTPVVYATSGLIETLTANGQFNTGSANVVNRLDAASARIGVVIANTSLVGGTITANTQLNVGSANVVGNIDAASARIGAVIANTSLVGGTITANTQLNAGSANVVGGIDASSARIGVVVANTSLLGGIITANTQLNAGSANVVGGLDAGSARISNIIANTSLLGGTITANTSLNAGSANVVGLMQANTANVGTLSAVTAVIGGTVFANTQLNAGSANVINGIDAGSARIATIVANTSLVAGTITANTQLNVGSANVVGGLDASSARIGVVVANTSLLGGTITANTQLNAGSANVVNGIDAGSARIGVVVANTSLLGGTITANTTLSGGSLNINSSAVIGTTLNVASISANTYINTQTIYADTRIYAKDIVANSSIQAVSANITGNLSVAGNFLINGTTINNSDTLVLYGNTAITGGQTAKFGVNRGEQTSPTFSPNPYIMYDNTDKQWKIRAINGATGAEQNTYYTIVTEKYTANTNNSGIVQLSSATNDTSTNKALTLAGAFDLANTAQTVYVAANSAYTQAQTAYGAANSGYTSAYAQAQTAYSAANSGYTAAYAQAQTAYSAANSGYTAAYAQAQTAYGAANTAYGVAVTKFNSTGGTISGDVTITGSLVINGTTTTVNTSTVTTQDSMIKLANNNTAGDSLDIGFYGQANTGSITYTGLVRKAGSNFFLFKGITSDPTSNVLPAGSVTLANTATLQANITGGIVSGLGAAIAIADGGTNNTTFTTGQRLLFDGSKIASRANTTTTVTGSLGADKTITSFTTNAYGEVTAYTGTAIAITSGQVSGLATSATTDTTNASNITSGTLPNARLSSVPNSALANSSVTINSKTVSLGGSVDVNSSIAITSSQVSGLATSATTDTSNATNISSGTLNVNRLPYTPIQQGGGTGQNTNKVYIGWNLVGTNLLLQVDSTDFGSTWPINVNGNSATVTNGVYTNVSYSNPSWITSLASTKITGTIPASNVSGLAASATTDTSNASNITSGTLSTNRLSISSSGYPGVTVVGGDGVMEIGSFIDFHGNPNDAVDFRARIDASTANTMTISSGLGGGLNLTATGSITAYSDERLKSNVKTIENALEKTAQLRGVTYERNGEEGLGVIAQEVQKVLPQVVLEGQDEQKTLSVAYGNIVGLLIEAIKELKAEIEELKRK